MDAVTTTKDPPSPAVEVKVRIISIHHTIWVPGCPLCSGILPQAEPPLVEVDLETSDPAEHSSAKISETKEERTTIGKL